MDVGVGTLLYNIGFARSGQGKYSAAIRHFLEGLTLLQPLDEPVATAECLIGIADVLLQVNQLTLGIQTLSTAKAAIDALEAQGEMDPVDQAEYERIYAAAQAADPNWLSNWQMGQTIPLEQIIERVFASAPLVLSATQDL